MTRPSIAAFGALLLGLLAACSTPTPYRASNGDGTGYSDQRIETDRYRVTFTGNDATSFDTVQNYALYRAAELTLAAGFDQFTVVSRSTESRAGGLSPGRIGVGVGSGGGGSGFGIGVSTFTGGGAETYTTFMDVSMADGPVAADDQAAYDARAVLQNLNPTVIRPGTQ